LVAVLRDSSTSIFYVGLETKDDLPVHHIRMRKEFANHADPDGLQSRLSTRDYYIDPSTLQIRSTLDMVHPKDSSTFDLPHEMQFSDYRAINGVIAPFS